MSIENFLPCRSFADEAAELRTVLSGSLEGLRIELEIKVCKILYITEDIVDVETCKYGNEKFHKHLTEVSVCKETIDESFNAVIALSFNLDEAEDCGNETVDSCDSFGKLSLNLFFI